MRLLVEVQKLFLLAMMIVTGVGVVDLIVNQH